MGIAPNNKHGGTGGGAWMWLDPKTVAAVHIAEEDPEHEEHELHKWRTSLDNPDFAELVESIRVLRMDALMNAKPVLLYLDGDKSTLADGRRTICAVRIVNAESKPADRLSVRAMTTKDPAMARDVNNANRAPDPPIFLARRYVRAFAIDNDKKAAAARVGLTYAHAEVLRKCLELPQDIQAQINRGEIAPDIAVRAAAGGGKAAREAVKAATGPGGKVDAGKAKAAARNAPKPSGPPTPRRLLSFRAGLDDAAKEGSPMAIARDIVDALGGDAAAKGRLPRDVAQAVTLALESSRPGRRPAKAGA